MPGTITLGTLFKGTLYVRLSERKTAKQEESLACAAAPYEIDHH